MASSASGTTIGTAPPQDGVTFLDAETVQQAADAETTVAPPSSWRWRLFERAARGIGHQHLVKLAQQRGKVAQSLDDVPKRMHRVANQTRLALELVDDFIAGRYREIPWHSLALLSAALLYTVSPADVIPEWVPYFGTLDDLAVIAVATRIVRKELEKYCKHKHYSVSAYFG